MMEEENYENLRGIVYHQTGANRNGWAHRSWADWMESEKLFWQNYVDELLLYKEDREILSMIADVYDAEIGEPVQYEPRYVANTDPKFRRYTEEDFYRLVRELREGPDDACVLTELNEYLDGLRKE